jgi:cobalt-zinc-cadmium efflux system outer membrane protein
MLSDSYQYYRNPNVFSGHAIMVTQAFPLWGKRDLRREAALADLDAARGREQATRDALDERIKIVFAQYYAASRALAVNQEVIAVTRGMRSTAEARYAAGTGDQAAAIRALGEETSASIETARLEGDRAAAREVLNALLARPANAPLAEPLRLRRLPAMELAIAPLVERARGSSPSLTASGAEISAARSRAALAEKAWYPDLTVGAGPLVQTNNRPPGVAATIGFNIPSLGDGRLQSNRPRRRSWARRSNTMRPLCSTLARPFPKHGRRSSRLYRIILKGAAISARRLRHSTGSMISNSSCSRSSWTSKWRLPRSNV